MALTDTYKNKDSPNLCRVCMSQSKNMKCVFSTKANRTVEDLEYCTGIRINKEDGLPTMLCRLCVTTLDIAHKFKALCLRSDDIFRKLLTKQNLANDPNRIKVEREEAIEVDTTEFEYQELETKREIDDDEDIYANGDETMCNLPSPNPTIRSRLKTKTKKKIKSPIKKSKATKNLKNKINGAKEEKSISKDILNPGKGFDPRRERKLNCPLCEIKFSSQEEQIEHIKDQHDNCEWICEICGKTFKHRSSHYHHVQSHFPPKHHCNHCDYKTWHKADLNKHLRMHNGIKNYVCEYCTKGFHNSSNLRGHIRLHHGTVVKNHVCPRCGRAFYAPNKLKRHIDTHDNIKRFECDVCHDRFSRRCQWKTHLKKMHDISIPRARPGRPKLNMLIGVQDSTMDSVNLLNK